MRLQSKKAQKEAHNSIQRVLFEFEYVKETLNEFWRRGQGRGGQDDEGRGRNGEQEERVFDEVIQSIEINAVDLS